MELRGTRVIIDVLWFESDDRSNLLSNFFTPAQSEPVVTSCHLGFSFTLLGLVIVIKTVRRVWTDGEELMFIVGINKVVLFILLISGMPVRRGFHL